MEQLPGFPAIQIYEAMHDDKLDARFPWLREAFDRMLLTGISQDLEDTFASYPRHEFPISSMIIMPETDDTFKVMGISPTNMTNTYKDSSAHAERMAIKMATPIRKKHVPEGAVLLSTLEPCSGCASDIVRSGIKHVVFGASQSDVKDKIVEVNGLLKPFDVEPANYNAEDFILERNPSATVDGSYRRTEVLDYMRTKDV